MSFGRLGALGTGFGKLGVLGGASNSTPVPAYRLNFATGTYTGDTLANLASCSRASTGYATNADGTLTSFGNNALRIGIGKGLLVEEARTNLCLWSQDLSNAAWSLLNAGTGSAATVTANYGSVAAPDGTLTATRIQFSKGTGTSSGDYSLLRQSIGSGGGTSHTGTNSVYVTATSNTQKVLVYLNSNTGSPTIAEYTLTAGVWTRVQITETNAALTNWIPSLGLYGPSSSVNTADVLVWGEQVETDAAFATSYIPTTTVAVTRAADNISATGGLSSTLAAAAGSLIVNTSGLIASRTATLVDSNGNILLGATSGNALTDNLVAGLTTGNTATWTGSVKGGIAWNGSGRTLILNNGTPATDANAMTPATTFHLGSLSGSSAFLDGYLKDLAAYNVAISAAALGVATT